MHVTKMSLINILIEQSLDGAFQGEWKHMMKQIMQMNLNMVKNPNWWETDQSVIQKHDRGGEPWSTEKQLQLFKWSERDLNP